MGTRSRSRRSRRSRRQSRSGATWREDGKTKRQPNEFFRKMLNAKRNEDESFQYKGKTYRRYYTEPPRGSHLTSQPYYSAD